MQVRIVNAIKQWRVDSDGFLRVTACILKEGVYPYNKSEMEGADAVPDTDGKVYQYIPASAFTENALKTLEGKPVIIGEHDWQTSRENDPVGAVAGNVMEQQRPNEIVVDLLITDEEVKNKIMSKELQEVSAAYEADFVIEDGYFNGEHFHGKQTNLRFNHILLLPEGCGRCGHDVRILNSNNKIKNRTQGRLMNVIKMKLKNGVEKEYQFESENDADQADKMVADQTAFNAEELQTAMEEIKNCKEQITELNAKLNEAIETANKYKNQIEELTSAEGQAELAQTALEQNEDEDEILNSEFDTEEERTEIKNRCKNAKTYADRRKTIVCAVMNSKGRSTNNWDTLAYDGAFEMLRATARSRNAKVMGGVKTKNSLAINRDNLTRILRPLKAN